METLKSFEFGHFWNGDEVHMNPQLLHLLSFACQSCFDGEWGRARESPEVCIMTSLVWSFDYALKAFVSSRGALLCVCIFLKLFFIMDCSDKNLEIQLTKIHPVSVHTVLTCYHFHFSSDFNHDLVLWTLKLQACRWSVRTDPQACTDLILMGLYKSRWFSPNPSLQGIKALEKKCHFLVAISPSYYKQGFFLHLLSFESHLPHEL